MKRQAEELELSLEGEGPEPIQKSPVKLLNTVTSSRKKRKEDTLLPSSSPEPGASPNPEDHHRTDEVNDSELPSSGSNSPDRDPPTDELALNSHRPFPCVWLNGSGATDPDRASPEAPNTPPQLVAHPGDRVADETMEVEPPHIAPVEVAPTADPISNGTENVPSAESPPSAPEVASHRKFPCVWLTGNGYLPEKLPSPEIPRSHPPLVGRPNELPVNHHGDAGPAPPSLNHLPQTPLTTVNVNGENISVEVCPECHKVFKRKVYLQRHMEREHWSTAKVFKCDDCSYETKHQSNLSVHRRIHTGERPYHCGVCGQRYTQGHLLKSHIRSRHNGNMEYYNLDKKSDSTRGRKSLDMKHEPTSVGMTGGGGKHADKISQLVQQMEQQRKMSSLLPPSMSMNQFMNSVSPYMNSLRPLMASPLGLSAANLMGPRGNLMFSLGNLQNGLQANPLLSMPLLGHTPMQASGPNSPDTGIKIPLKVPEVPNPGNILGQAQSIKQESEKASPQTQSPPQPHHDEALPQDLTTKKNHIQNTAEIMNGHLGHDASKIDSGKMDSRKMDSIKMESNKMEPSKLDTSAFYPSYNGYYSDSPMTSSNSDDETEPIKKGYEAHAVNDLRRLRDPCLEGDCDHAKKLRGLRRNIVRMLSVLTPDLSIENGLDYNTDQVDQLLYEVIYSNIEDVGADT